MLLGCAAMLVGALLLKKFTDVSWGWLLLLACPLLHIFMMKGMHQNKSNTDTPDKDVSAD